MTTNNCKQAMPRNSLEVAKSVLQKIKTCLQLFVVTSKMPLNILESAISVLQEIKTCLQLFVVTSKI